MADLEPQILSLLRQAEQSSPEVKSRTRGLLSQYREDCREAIRLHQIDLAGQLLETGEVDSEAVGRVRDERIEAGRTRLRDRLRELLGE